MISPHSAYSLDLKAAPKILVYLFGSLGDSIVGIPALRAVKRNFPGHEIVLLQNVNDPETIVRASQVIPRELIDRYFEYEARPGQSSKSQFFGLWLKIRRERFEAAVYLVSSERPARSVHRDKLFFRACGIKRLIGFHPFADAELFPRDPAGRPAMTDQEAIRKLRRLEKDEIRVDPELDLRQPLIELSAAEIETAAGWLAETRRSPNSTLIAIAPGCKTTANTWPVENFIELGRRMNSELNCEIIIVGGRP